MNFFIAFYNQEFANCKSLSQKKPQIKINSLKKLKKENLIQTLNGTVVNRALPSSNERSFKITLTVPLSLPNQDLRKQRL